MISAKIVLIILLLIVLRAFLVQESLVLIKKIVALVMFLLLTLLVLFPGVSTRIANAIGIGRGVDLVFYLSHLLFLFLTVVLWRRIMTIMAVVTKLSREIAMQNSVEPNSKKSQADSALE